jgi:hypothetical protein
VQDSWDSIDRELDAMEQPPPEVSVPVVAAAPPAQHAIEKTVKQPQAEAVEQPAPESVTTYNISIFPIAEMKKDDPKTKDTLFM